MTTLWEEMSVANTKPSLSVCCDPDGLERRREGIQVDISCRGEEDGKSWGT